MKSLLEDSYKIFVLNDEVILAYCELYSELRKKRELIPEVAQLLVATNIGHNVVLIPKSIGLTSAYKCVK